MRRGRFFVGKIAIGAAAQSRQAAIWSCDPASVGLLEETVTFVLVTVLGSPGPNVISKWATGPPRS